MPHPSVPNPITQLAALHLLDKYHTSQTELRPTYRRAASNEFYAMTKVLYGQGVPSRRRSSGFIVQAVIDAWKGHQNGPIRAVRNGDEVAYREVLHARRQTWLAEWELEAIIEIAATVNAAITCKRADCSHTVMDEHDDLCKHHANLREEKRRADDAFLSKAVDNILTDRARPADPISFIHGHEHKYYETPDHRAACSCGAWEQTESTLVLGVRHAAWVDHITALETTS